MGDIISSRALHKAQRIKNDEFYTLYGEIDRELIHYIEFLNGKSIYCNCDNPYKSQFTRWFLRYFHRLNLKKIVCTSYNPIGKGLFFSMDKSKIPDDCDFTEDVLDRLIDENTSSLYGNGDFKSYECIKLINQSDIVVTNPPFSKFRDFFQILVENNVSFIIMCPIFALTYNIVVDFLKEDIIRLGWSRYQYFSLPSGKKMQIRSIRWVTNLPITPHPEFICLTKEYVSDNYPKYDNIEAINVGNVADIPKDYDGIMGVPLTVFDFWNPKQFKVVGYVHSLYIDGKNVFQRILICHRSYAERNSKLMAKQKNVTVTKKINIE